MLSLNVSASFFYAGKKFPLHFFDYSKCPSECFFAFISDYNGFCSRVC